MARTQQESRAWAVWRWLGRGSTSSPTNAEGDVLTLNADLVPEWQAPSGGGGLTAEQVRDTIATALVAGSNVTITVDDPGDTITIDAPGGGGGITHLQVLARGLGA